MVGLKMPNKCGVVNSTSNYNEENKCCVFRLPKEESERQKWIDKLPPRENFVINPAKFFIYERHWEANPPVIKLPGGSTRPSIPPSVFMCQCQARSRDLCYCAKYAIMQFHVLSEVLEIFLRFFSALAWSSMSSPTEYTPLTQPHPHTGA